MSDASVSAPRRQTPPPGSGKRDMIPPPLGTAEAPDGGGDVQFLTEPKSPFADGYSITKEKEALADMFEMDQPEKDARWTRFTLLIQREEMLAQNRLEYRLEQGAEKVVPYVDANKMSSLGSLVNDGEDAMTLHTKEGFRLFMGRRQDPDKKYAPIIGAKRSASAMRGFWAHSANDNPYADWALLRAVQGMRQFTHDLKQLSDKYLASLRELEAKGLSFSILRSGEPQQVALQFKSPYGYLMAELTVDFDHFVRVVKTAVRKGRLTDAEGHDVVRAMTRRIRGWMEELARFDKFLWRPELVKLSRSDFLPGADAEAKKRVEAVTGIFGSVPADIFSGKILPPYTRRRTHITDTERALLERVGQELVAADEDTGASDGTGEAKLI
jgi:integrating conjugative element protein (TIGR03761 family)